MGREPMATVTVLQRLILRKFSDKRKNHSQSCKNDQVSCTTNLDNILPSQPVIKLRNTCLNIRIDAVEHIPPHSTAEQRQVRMNIGLLCGDGLCSEMKKFLWKFSHAAMNVPA